MALEKDMEDRKKRREKDMKKAEELKNIGNEFLKNEELDKAIDKYTEALEFQKDNKAIYLNRAWTYIKKKKFGKAILDCTKVIEYAECFEKGFEESRDACFKAFLRRALCYKEKKQVKEGLNDIEEALKLIPNDK